MQIEKRSPDGNFASTVIRAGVVMLSRKYAKPGEKIFLPGPDWTPEDGHDGLVPVTVEEVYEEVAVCKDAGGQTWALWLS